MARSTTFGRGEETLTDTSVRDTWELTPAQLTLGGPDRTALLDRALEHFRDELGLQRTARLQATPHAMLVYGREQFFHPTRTRRKTTSWWAHWWCHCSRHTGGELVIDYAGEARTYRASKEVLTLVAFYSGCRHEVKPVRSGYRATLTFNLLATAGAPAPEAGTATEFGALP